MKEYKRLTKEYQYNCNLCKDRQCTTDKFCMDRIDCNLYNRLAELEDKIENGTLIELPCKLGDWLYYIHENVIHKAKVEEIIFSVYKHGIKNESIDIYAYDFKNKLELSYYYTEDFSKLDTETIDFVKTFLTKAEAEKKLKELQNER